jgi:hypothetical protein
MSSIINIPFKENPECALVYLIDENLCLKDSLEIYNYNVQSLSATLLTLEGHAARWNQIYSFFVKSSSDWFYATSNIAQFQPNWDSAYTTVTTLSAKWHKPFSIYYPEVLDYTLWYGSSNNQQLGTEETYKTTILTNWLNKNFAVQNYIQNLEIDLFVYLNYAKEFNYRFYKAFYEPCTPAGGQTVECPSCPLTLNRGCNHHGGRAGHGACDNAYKYCTQNGSQRSFKAACKGWSEKPDSGSKDIPPSGRTLKIGYNFKSSDTSVVRVLSIKYKNTGKTWEYVRNP